MTPRRRIPTTTTAIATGLALLALAALSGCGGVTFSENRDEVFKTAVEASLEEDDVVAAANAYHYLKVSTEDDPRYDRAMRLLANAAERMGLSYAASLWYLNIASNRRDPEVVIDAIRGLQLVIDKYPYDEDTIMDGYLARGEVSGLSPEDASFVNYYQGLDSMRQGLDEWADQRFEAISPRSSYKQRALYAQSVRILAAGNLTGAREGFEAILEAKRVPEDLRITVLRDLARIAFEEQRYGDALEYYREIRETAPDDPLLLLEMAWSHYYRGESRRAVGLLIALDAPAYKDLIAPERFLLEALAMRRLCQFEPARSAAVRLRTRHERELEDLRRGIPLLESDALRAAAGLRVGGKEVADLSNQIRTEYELIKDDIADDVGPELGNRLLQLYELGLEELKRREDELLLAEMESLANELLNAEEGTRLILHEIGVSLLRGRKRLGVEERVVDFDEEEDNPVLYTFEGEFWTDELDDIVVTTEDRCID